MDEQNQSPSYKDFQMRLHALQLAVDENVPGDVVERAQKYYEFLKGLGHQRADVVG